MSKDWRGPWKADGGRVTNADGDTVVYDEGSPGADEARLIAAAPAMYELLKRIEASGHIGSASMERDLTALLTSIDGPDTEEG